MKIEHIAIWVKDLELIKEFYTKYFNMLCSDKYTNPAKQFSSYFLSLKDGARIEIMHRPDITFPIDNNGISVGFAHLAFSTGNREKVDQLTKKLRLAGYTIAGEPRVTGDGYYESVILDPEGNHIEITE